MIVISAVDNVTDNDASGSLSMRSAMSATQLRRNLSVYAGIVAVVAMGAVTAGCGKSNQPAPSSSSTPTSSSQPSVSPTQNQPNPTDGNSFTPTPHPVQPSHPPGR
jgi:hypothetical protein